MNIYKKYTSGVFCMQSEKQDLNHGDQAIITTKYGKEISVTVWKKLKQANGHTYYSVIREDGLDRKEWMRRKLERAENAASRQERISNEYYEKSQEGKDFLVLAEPIKIGHHSEKRHRALYDRNWNRMGKSVRAADKAKEYAHKAEEIERRLKKEINLDTPESIEALEARIADLEETREAIKAADHERYQLSNIGANIRRYKERLKTAKELWEI